MRTVNVNFSENAIHDLELGTVSANVLRDICRVLNAGSLSDYQPTDDGIVEYEYDENGEFIDSFDWSVEVKAEAGKWVVNLFA